MTITALFSMLRLRGAVGARARLMVSDVITRYFRLDAARDVDGVTDLFTEDAVVVDERNSHHGREEIRAWRAGPASKYTYTTEIIGAEAHGTDRYVIAP